MALSLSIALLIGVVVGQMMPSLGRSVVAVTFSAAPASTAAPPSIMALASLSWMVARIATLVTSLCWLGLVG